MPISLRATSLISQFSIELGKACWQTGDLHEEMDNISRWMRLVEFLSFTVHYVFRRVSDISNNEVASEVTTKVFEESLGVMLNALNTSGDAKEFLAREGRSRFIQRMDEYSGMDETSGPDGSRENWLYFNFGINVTKLELDPYNMGSIFGNMNIGVAILKDVEARRFAEKLRLTLSDS